MNRPTLLILALVTLLVVATTWLSRKSEQPRPKEAAGAEGVADYFIRGFEGTVTAKNGAPSHLLKADSLVHYAGNDMTELEQPDLTIFRPQGERWTVSARHGRMQGEGDTVFLSGRVRLRQRSQRQPLQLRTETLQLYPQRHYAETDRAVDITAPGGRIQGVGMQIFGEEDRLVLLSDIRGAYDATAR
jgi:lipopolysaccharide export system protein LptC